MKKLLTLLILTAIAVTAACRATSPAPDTLAAIKKKGVLVAGVKNTLPPFGYTDEVTGDIIGYDIDFLHALARKLGVKVKLKPVSSANRIEQLLNGDVDILAATMSKVPQREKQIDFSHIYFYTGQKFITTKGSVKSLQDLEGKLISTAKGSTSELNVRKALPGATVISFDDYPQAFLALQQGKVQAVTTDELILAGLLSRSPQKDNFEIPNIQISDEAYGLGMRKGDPKLIDFVNNTLLEMEESGEARKIFDKWFGPKTYFQLQRTFIITAPP